MKRKNLILKFILVMSLIATLTVFTSCAKKRTVVFDSNGGSSVESVVVKNNKKVQKPADPTRPGYVFEYWMLNGEKFDFETKIKSDITLVAKWKENQGSSALEKVEVEGPKNVKLSNNVVSWDPVENATGYIVFVDGQEIRVSSTSHPLEATSKAETIICVVAVLDGNKITKLSDAVYFRNSIDKSLVNEVLSTLNCHEKVAEELAYTLAKYDLTLEDIEQIMDELNTSSNAIFELLSSEEAPQMLEIASIIVYAQALQSLEQSSKINVNLSETQKEIINEIYLELVNEGVYQPSQTYENSFADKYFIECLAPWVIKSAFNYNISLDNMILNMLNGPVIIPGSYLVRNGSDVILHLTDEVEYTIPLKLINDIKAYYEYEGYDEASNNALNQLYLFEGSKYLPNVEELVGKMTEAISKLKATLSVNAKTIISAVNKVLLSEESINSLMVLYEKLQSNLPTIFEDPTKVSDILDEAVAFKDEIIKALREVLPTKADCQALEEVLSVVTDELLSFYLSDQLEFLKKYSSYDYIETLDKLLDYLESINTSKYNLELIAKYAMGITNTPADGEKAVNEVAKIIADLISTLQGLMDKSEINIAESLGISSMFNPATISYLQTVLGFKLDEESLKELNSAINEIYLEILEYKVTEEEILEVFEFAAQYFMTANPNPQVIAKDLLDEFLPLVLANVDKEFISKYENFFRGYFEYMFIVSHINSEEFEMPNLDNLMNLVKNEIEVLKKIVESIIVTSMGYTYEDIPALLDMWIDATSTSEKTEVIVKFVEEVCTISGYKYETLPLYKTLNSQSLRQDLIALKQLVGIKEYELTEAERELIENFGLFTWEYPTNEFSDFGKVTYSETYGTIEVTMQKEGALLESATVSISMVEVPYELIANEGKVEGFTMTFCSFAQDQRSMKCYANVLLAEYLNRNSNYEPLYTYMHITVEYENHIYTCQMDITSLIELMLEAKFV